GCRGNNKETAMSNTHASSGKNPDVGIYAFSCSCAATSLESLDPATRAEAIACFELDGFILPASPAFAALYDKGLIHTDGYAISPFHEVLTASGVNVKPLW